MSYLYQNRCLDTQEQLYNYIAAQCPPISGNFSIQCVPTLTDIAVYATDLSTDATVVTTLAVTEIPCSLDLIDQTAFYWQLVAILVAGFAVRAIIKAFQ